MSLFRRITAPCCPCFDRRPAPAANREANYRPAERPKPAIKDQQPRALKQPSNASILSDISTLPAASARASEINPLQDLINVVDRALELDDDVKIPLLTFIHALDGEALQAIITASNSEDPTKLSDQFIRATSEKIKNTPALALIGFALLSNPHFMIYAEPIKQKFHAIFMSRANTNPIVENILTATQKLLAQRVTPTSNSNSDSSPASGGSTEPEPHLAFASARQQHQEQESRALSLESSDIKAESAASSSTKPASLDQSWHYPENLKEFQALHNDLHNDDLATQICFTLLNANLPEEDRATLSTNLNEHSLTQQKTGELIASAKASNPHFMQAANLDNQKQLAILYQHYAKQVEEPEQETQALMIMVALIANPNASIELVANAFHSAIGTGRTPQQLANPNPTSTTEIARSFAYLLMYLRSASSNSSSQPASVVTTTSPQSSEKDDIEAASPTAAITPDLTASQGRPQLLTRRASADLFANLTTEERIQLAEQPIPDAADEPSGARRLHSKTSLISVTEADEK